MNNVKVGEISIDVRYNTKVVGGKVCFPSLSEEDSGEAEKYVKKAIETFEN